MAKARTSWVGVDPDVKTETQRLPGQIWRELLRLRDTGVNVLHQLSSDVAGAKDKQILDLQEELRAKDKLLYEITETLRVQRGFTTALVEQQKIVIEQQKRNNLSQQFVPDNSFSEPPPDWDSRSGPQYNSFPEPSPEWCWDRLDRQDELPAYLRDDSEFEVPPLIRQGQELPPLTHDCGPLIKEDETEPATIVLVALRYLAYLDDDRANAVNGVGFNKADSKLGHKLAKLVDLTDEQTQIGFKILNKYHAQLAKANIDIKSLKLDPESLPIEHKQEFGTLSKENGLHHSLEFDAAIALLESGENCFITGKAGTGKTTLLQYWINQTTKKVVIVAPTGIAARNAGGVTIHSFFGLPPRLVTPDEMTRSKDSKQRQVFQNIDVIIVDEVSMLLASTVDCMHVKLQKNRDSDKPFGGVQMVFVGDMFQLAPIVSKKKTNSDISEAELLGIWGYANEFFFSAHILNDSLRCVELQKVYRQKDGKFLDILNNIRIGSATQNDFDVLNENVNPKYIPKKDELSITLVPTNKLVAEINAEALEGLYSDSFKFESNITGIFNPKDCPAEPQLELKVGAQVMFVSNDEHGEYVNGSMGKVSKLTDDSITVDIGNEYPCEVDKVKWENTVYIWDAKKKKLSFETIGTLEQFPVKLAYAITVHKSQSLQFEKLMIAIGSGRFFGNGQLYVALSRCTTLNGLVLKERLGLQDMKVDSRVIAFFDGQRNLF